MVHLQNLASDQQYPCGEISTTVISKVNECSITQGTGNHWIFWGAHGCKLQEIWNIKTQSLFQVSEVSKKQKPKLNSCFGKSNADNIFQAIRTKASLLSPETPSWTISCGRAEGNNCCWELTGIYKSTFLGP